MPYAVQKRKNEYIVKNTETGEVKGTHKARTNALKQMRLLYMIKGGKKPAGKKPILKGKPRRKKKRVGRGRGLKDYKT